MLKFMLEERILKLKATALKYLFVSINFDIQIHKHGVNTLRNIIVAVLLYMKNSTVGIPNASKSSSRGFSTTNEEELHKQPILLSRTEIRSGTLEIVVEELCGQCRDLVEQYEVLLHECWTTFWSMTIYKDDLHRSDFWPNHDIVTELGLIELRKVSIKQLWRVWHDNRGHLFPQTPGYGPFGICMCPPLLPSLSWFFWTVHFKHPKVLLLQQWSPSTCGRLHHLANRFFLLKHDHWKEMLRYFLYTDVLDFIDSVSDRRRENVTVNSVNSLFWKRPVAETSTVWAN